MTTEEIAARFAEGLARYQAGAPAEAAAHFAAVLQCQPDHVDALRLRGLSLVRTGATADALPLLARARQLAPHDALTHLHYGIGLQEAGRHARAAALFRRATMMLPNDAAPWTNLSTAILALGHGKAARAAARRAIALAPQSAEARYALGRAEQAEHNPAGARAAFAEVTRIAPGFADAWVNLGIACFQLGQVGDAIQAMRRALHARPNHGAAEANLAGFLLLHGDYDAAFRRLRDVLAREPDCVPARLNLANALLLDREASEALALLEGPAPAGRDGAHWRAHRAMALLLLQRHAEAAAELAAIDRPYDAEILILWRRIALAEHAGSVTSAMRLADRLAMLAADERSGLLEHRIVSHFDLAGLHGRHGDRGRAMRHWQAGHTLLARAQPFSRETFAKFFAAQEARYDAARLHRGPRSATPDRRPVFIVGLPRSGTTLTEQILAAHPQVHGGGERNDLHQAILRLAGTALEAASVRRLATLDAAALSATAATYLAGLDALAPAATLITDKMPSNALFLGFIATLLPGARVILCRRDPRDVGLSIFQRRFFGYHPYAHDLADLGWYMGRHEHLMRHWLDVLPIPLLEVELSDWVRDFSGTLYRLLAFLDLPYHPACEQYHTQTRRVRTASAAQVQQRINARGLGRWRNYAPQLGPMLAELAAAGLEGAVDG